MSQEQDDVAGILADALLKAKDATAVMCCLALKDGTALTFSCGPFIVKAGMVKVMDGLCDNWSHESEKVEEE
jgi:hypothetical protein